jgi:SAM-dependent methyltransferase
MARLGAERRPVSAARPYTEGWYGPRQSVPPWDPADTIGTRTDVWMNPGESRTRSGFSRVDAAADPTQYVRRLDSTGASPFWQAMKQRIIALLDLREGDRVLDVGCGTGDDVRALARLVAPTGQAVGVDDSEVMVAEAARRTRETGLPAEFYRGDAQHLRFPDGTFHGCRVERVLQHLDSPGRAIAEMARVTRSGGRIVAVEPDYGASFIASPDRMLTRKILNCRRDHFSSGTVGRDLTRLFKAASLIDIGASIFTSTVTDLTSDGERLTLRKYVDSARMAGEISETDGHKWLGELMAMAKEGQYRRTMTIFLVSGRKGDADRPM